MLERARKIKINRKIKKNEKEIENLERAEKFL